MKKIFALLLACMMAFAMLLPCLAAAPAVGASVTIGSYPQTRVTSYAELAALNSISVPLAKHKTETLPDGSTLHFADVTCGGQLYRVVYPQNKGPALWFRFEPLTWTVVASENKLYTLLCNTIIAPDPGANAAESAVYAWLNDYFYKTAFSETERTCIVNVSDFFGAAVPYVFLPNGSLCSTTHDAFAAATRSGYAGVTTALNAPVMPVMKSSTPAAKQACVKAGGTKTLDVTNETQTAAVVLRPMITCCIDTNFKPGWVISLLLHLLGH